MRNNRNKKKILSFSNKHKTAKMKSVFLVAIRISIFAW